jgi:hypothetical protein
MGYVARIERKRNPGLRGPSCLAPGNLVIACPPQEDVGGQLGYYCRCDSICTAVTSKTMFLTLSGFTDVILAFTRSPSGSRPD